ncbi:hypothetical protein HYDPIDRAFT_31198 [Hydnomerulius pinastri MD-312]|uniref:Uncharacterized protein n=1 Tax=Hydnomerulius pinastri MD-312 TaxID=994086 RepID=A0A0C9W4X9_9AGAM|nr:hypothetical protein HYDPIDRAFT_31198 [Hydnomerulius pinastri MD-312]
MAAPIPVYRQNPIHHDWEVASTYDSDDCESLGRSLYDEPRGMYGDGPVYAPSPNDQGSGMHHHLQLVLYDDRDGEYRAGYPCSPPPPPPQNRDLGSTAANPWDARFAPGKPGGFFIPHAPALPPPGSVMSPASPAGISFPPRLTELYIPPVPPLKGRMAPDSDMDADLLDAPPPLPVPLTSPPVRSPARSSPALGLAMPLAATLPSPTRSGAGSRHASPIHPPPLYHELPSPVPPHPADGYPAVSPTTLSRRSAAHEWERDAGLSYSYSGSAQGPRGEPPEVRRGAGQAPSYYPYPSDGSERGRSERSLADYAFPGGGPGNGGGGGGTMRTPRPAVRQRRPSVWQRLVRRFSPSPQGVARGQS